MNKVKEYLPEAAVSEVDSRFQEARTRLTSLETTVERLEKALNPVFRTEPYPCDEPAAEGRPSYSQVGENIYSIEQRIAEINRRLNNYLDVLAI